MKNECLNSGSRAPLGGVVRVRRMTKTKARRLYGDKSDASNKLIYRPHFGIAIGMP